MAKGPRYRRSNRRREEGKTNYHRRLRLLKSKKLRVVIRASNNHIIVQIIQSKFGGDKVLVSAHSTELTSKFGWKANTGNVPAAYLTGFLAGLRAKKQNIYHRIRVLAAFKGILKSELDVPYKESFFPDDLDERITGAQIEKFANLLKSENPEKYDQIFSGYLNKNKINPLKISQIVSNTFKTIENNA
jgi:large subunit ribosomal protein L18